MNENRCLRKMGPRTMLPYDLCDRCYRLFHDEPWHGCTCPDCLDKESRRAKTPQNEEIAMLENRFVSPEFSELCEQAFAQIDTGDQKNLSDRRTKDIHPDSVEYTA